jgi:hypothetical protein
MSVNWGSPVQYTKSHGITAGHEAFLCSAESRPGVLSQGVQRKGEKADHGRMVSSGLLRRVALVRTDVSEELSDSFIMVARNG